MTTFKSFFAMLALLFAVAACGTTGGNPVKIMSDAAFVNLSPEEQQAYITTMNSLPSLLETKRESEFRTGIPLYIGDGETGYTMQCQKLPAQTFSTVGFFPGHNPRGWSGDVTEAFAILYADRNCVIKTQTGEQGQFSTEQMFMNLSTAPDVRQLIATLGIQAATTLGSTKLASDGQCGKNCGMQISMDNGNSNRLSSNSDAVAVLEDVQVDTGVHVVNSSCGRRACSDYDTD